MPRFMPVQCSKCAVLQIKPAQKPGLRWCCSMCRKGEGERAAVVGAAPAAAMAAAESQVSLDVRQFVEELKLEEEEAEEMGAVANTFRGVESLGGASNWEGLYFQSARPHHHKNWKRVKPIEIYEDEFPRRVEKESSVYNSSSNKDHGRRFGSQQQQQPRHFLSSLWGRWHQKTSCTKDVVELMEFAGGNEENVAPPRS